MYKRQGYELCKEIKADIDLCHIPVIFFTAKNDLESKINGLKIGACLLYTSLPDCMRKIYLYWNAM